jgi:hypothetical protein
MALVGYFDILGTKDAVLADRFDDFLALDFVNPVGITAKFVPSVRFAVFSDSVIVAAETNIAYCYTQWFADFILVRGGIAEGPIRWVDDESIDRVFLKCPNLTFARVYGKALVLAHEMEQKSGPGAICYLTQNATEILRKLDENAVIEGVTPMLGWADERKAKILRSYMETGMKEEEVDNVRHRLFSATKYYWEQVIKQKKYVSDKFALFTSE